MIKYKNYAKSLDTETTISPKKKIFNQKHHNNKKYNSTCEKIIEEFDKEKEEENIEKLKKIKFLSNNKNFFFNLQKKNKRSKSTVNLQTVTETIEENNEEKKNNNLFSKRKSSDLLFLKPLNINYKKNNTNNFLEVEEIEEEKGEDYYLDDNISKNSHTHSINHINDYSSSNSFISSSKDGNSHLKKVKVDELSSDVRTNMAMNKDSVIDEIIELDEEYINNEEKENNNKNIFKDLIVDDIDSINKSKYHNKYKITNNEDIMEEDEKDSNSE